MLHSSQMLWLKLKLFEGASSQSWLSSCESWELQLNYLGQSKYSCCDIAASLEVCLKRCLNKLNNDFDVLKCKLQKSVSKIKICVYTQCSHFSLVIVRVVVSVLLPIYSICKFSDIVLKSVCHSRR